MSNTIIYNEAQAKEIELAVMSVFKCELKDIVSVPDTLVKQVVVFILFRYFYFDKRNIGRVYSITHLFVPTVTERIEKMLLDSRDMREKVFNVLNIVGYGKSEVRSA